MLDYWVAVFLLLLNIVQFVFWSWQTHRLVNKLMSRNFADYDFVVNGPKAIPKQAPDYEAIVEEREILDDLNAMLPT